MYLRNDEPTNSTLLNPRIYCFSNNQTIRFAHPATKTSANYSHQIIAMMNAPLSSSILPESESVDGRQPQWFCIQTKRRYEDFATYNLEKKGITVFSPKIEEHIVRNYRNVQRIVPLFPSYIFAKFDLLCEHNRARWTPGVKQILSNRRGPIQIEDEIIDGIAVALEQKAFDKSELKTGDMVTVSSGSFQGLNGIFQYYTSGEARVRVLLDLVYRKVVTEFDSSIIRKI
jgi:transcriptional antiterminator RfaH